MRKVYLRMNENNKYLVIKKLVETNGNKKRASIELNCTVRHINRMIKDYQEHGKQFFEHGNRNRRPVHTIDDATKALVVDLYLTKYSDSNFTHYSELLEKFEGIKVSPSTIRTTLLEKNILSPKARRSTKKKLKNHLKELKNNTNSKREIEIIQNAIFDIEDAHPRRPKCAYAGEMLQMDASVHLWFGKEKTHLHIAVDDATGAIVGAYFDVQETLNGYYNILHQILTDYGIPYKFLTDKRTVFEYKQKNPLQSKRIHSLNLAMLASNLVLKFKLVALPKLKAGLKECFKPYSHV